MTFGVGNYASGKYSRRNLISLQEYVCRVLRMPRKIIRKYDTPEGMVFSSKYTSPSENELKNGVWYTSAHV